MVAKRKRKEQGSRSIQTTYWRGNERAPVKITRAHYASTAVPNAVKHLQTDRYEATHCEVYDIDSGELHAVLKRSIGKNKIEILFKREVKENE